MNLTVPQVVAHTLISTLWAAGSTLTAKLVGERPSTGLMFGTAYSLITLPVNLATQSYMDNSASSLDWAKGHLIEKTQIAIATLIGAKMVNLLGRPLTPGMAYRIQFASIGLWSMIAGVIGLASLHFANSNPKHEWTQTIGRFRPPLEDVDKPINFAIFAIAAKCLGEQASTGALLGTAWSIIADQLLRPPIQVARQLGYLPSSLEKVTTRVAELVIGTFLAAKTVTLLGYPLTTTRALQIRMGLEGLIATAIYFSDDLSGHENPSTQSFWNTVVPRDAIAKIKEPEVIPVKKPRYWFW